MGVLWEGARLHVKAEAWEWEGWKRVKVAGGGGREAAG